jgi:hypothetical protein
MGKKKQPDIEAKKKVSEHKRFTSKLNADFVANMMAASGLLTGTDGPPPFTFVITIVVIPGITIKSINVNFVLAKQSDFETSGGKISCKVNAFVSTLTFLLKIDAEGESGTSTTFNLTCDGNKVFDKDQDIIISSTGKGGYSNPDVPLP